MVPSHGCVLLSGAEEPAWKAGLMEIPLKPWTVLFGSNVVGAMYEARAKDHLVTFPGQRLCPPCSSWCLQQNNDVNG
jgi:hypothetical protein